MSDTNTAGTTAPRPDESALIVRADEVVPFSLPGDEETYESQCLIDREGVMSRDLHINRFRLRAGRNLPGGCHPAGNDECYYLLRGRARLLLGGEPDGTGAQMHEIGPDTAIFIPGGTFHALHNPYDEDLVILTIWPKQPVPGANRIYDQRKQAWGTSFRKVTAAGVTSGEG